MEAKEQLINNIKEWIKIDGEISQLKTEIKEKNNNKKLLTEKLVSVMKTNSIDCFDINGGSLVYKKNKIIDILSFKNVGETSTIKSFIEVKKSDEIRNNITGTYE